MWLFKMGVRVKYTVYLGLLALLAVGAEAGAYIITPSQTTPKVVMHTPLGAVTIELFPAEAPITVDNFLQYVNADFYDELIVHRVINDPPNFGIVQAGGYWAVKHGSTLYGPWLVTEGLREAIINESYNGLSNLRGTVAMARTEEPNSATSQFYINTIDNTDLDLANDPCGFGYCVFGQVIQGMDIVDDIVQLPTLPPQMVNGMNDVPNYHLDWVYTYKIQSRVYVANDGSDSTGLGTSELPVKTIQKGIDVAANGGHVVVQPDTYTGTGNIDIDFNGKPITVRAVRSSDPLLIATTIIDCQSTLMDKHRAFYFNSGEDANSILEGFTIINGYQNDGGAIFCESSPTIKNCMFRNNTALARGGAIYCSASQPRIINCTFAANSSWNIGGALCSDNAAGAQLINSVLWSNTASDGPELAVLSGSSPSNLSVSYCDIQGGETQGYVEAGCHIDWGLGNFDLDPCFIDPDNNEYHLKSEAWQWTDANGWTLGTITSPCIDAGNPGSPTLKEYGYTTNRTNMGAFGQTIQASTPPPNWALLADINNDGFVDLTDFVYFARDFHYLGELSPADLNRSETVGIQDLGLFASDWLFGTSWYWAEQADFNGDKVINFKDYAALASNWLGSDEDITGDGEVDYDDIELFYFFWLQKLHR